MLGPALRTEQDKSSALDPPCTRQIVVSDYIAFAFPMIMYSIRLVIP